MAGNHAWDNRQEDPSPPNAINASERLAQRPPARPTGKPRQIPDKTIETVARSFCGEGARYGFDKLDFIRFVNKVLDIAMAEAAAQGGQGELHDLPDNTECLAISLGLPCSDGRIHLRELDFDQDKPILQRWLDDAYGRYFLLTCAVARFDNLHSVLVNPDNRFAIVCLNNGQPIAAVGFLHIDPDQQKAELRKLIGELQFRGQGYAKAASRLWLRYGFDVLGLRKIYLDTLQTNLRKIHLNEALGFSVEGILRNEVYLDSRERDALRMGICRTTS